MPKGCQLLPPWSHERSQQASLILSSILSWVKFCPNHQPCILSSWRCPIFPLSKLHYLPGRSTLLSVTLSQSRVVISLPSDLHIVQHLQKYGDDQKHWNSKFCLPSQNLFRLTWRKAIFVFLKSRYRICYHHHIILDLVVIVTSVFLLLLLENFVSKSWELYSALKVGVHYIPDICHGRHGHVRVNFFWSV